MSYRVPPPEHIRREFRDYLIRHGGTAGISGLGHTEEIKRFKFYLQTFEEFISQQETEEVSSLGQEAAKLSAEGRAEFWSWYYPVHWDEIFRTNLRSSFLISLMSFVEAQISNMCRDVVVIAGAPISVGDLKGSFFEKARLFLEKFGGFQHPAADVWAKLSQIYDVRNVFVHHGGFLPAYNHEKRVRQFIKRSGNLSETHGTLTLEQGFCHSALDVAQLFMQALADELSALCARVKEVEASSREP